MDLSKLPKLSGKKTDEPQASVPADQQQPPPAVPAPQSVPYAAAEPPGIGVAEVWLSVFVGLVLMFMGQEFARWGITTLTGGTYDSGVEWLTPEKRGQLVPYWEIQGHAALMDSAVFLFGFAMLAEGVLLGLSRLMPLRWRLLVLLALGIAVIVTAYNAVVLLIMLVDGYTPLAPILAVGFGGWMVFTQLALLRVRRDDNPTGGR